MGPADSFSRSWNTRDLNQVRLNDWAKGKSYDVSCHIICRNTHASVNLTGVSVFVQQVAKPERAVGLLHETFSSRGFCSRIGFGKQQEASLKHRLGFCLCGWSKKNNNRLVLSIQSLLGFLSVKMKLLGKHLMVVPARLKCECWHLKWSLLLCSALRALSESITLPSGSRNRCSQQWRLTNCYLQLSFLPLLIFSLCLLHFSPPCLLSLRLPLTPLWERMFTFLATDCFTGHQSLFCNLWWWLAS